MSYSAWSVTFGEQPSASKWNILGTNDAQFNTNFTRVGMPIQMLQTDYSADTSGNTVLPQDNTIPQNTEGFEVMSQAITPIFSTSNLLVEFEVLASSAGVNGLGAAVFRDSSVSALFATAQWQPQSAGDNTVSGSVKRAATATDPTTFKVRIGPDATQTVTFGGGRFSTVPHSFIRVTEIAG